MNRYFIYLSYNGKNFCGWQTQPNGISVQESIEKALTMILREETPIVGAGRTDAGVHASEMVAHFDSDKEKHYITNELPERLNRVLPREIAIQRIVPVRADAHARFDAISREYKYYLCSQKDPFCYDLKYLNYFPLDVERMNELAQILFEYTDFTSFSKLHTDVKTNNCRIMKAEWSRSDAHNLVFTIQADRFLRNMVRAIVGTLLEGGRGKLDARGFRRIIEAKNRNVAGTSVPGHALFLHKVDYPEELFE
ncbi:MAG: tRNA pseudouridine(38-40) synthase TruA [Dysgonamonadaceae bacterium]